MFSRKELTNTQIKRNKKGRKVLMRTLGIFELHRLADSTFKEFSSGKTVDEIFQTYSISKKHKNDYSILILNKFLISNSEAKDINHSEIRTLERFISLSSFDKTLKLGFICIRNRQ